MRIDRASFAALACTGFWACALPATELRLAQLSAEFVVNPSGHMLVPADRAAGQAPAASCGRAGAQASEACASEQQALVEGGPDSLIEPYPVEMLAPDYPPELASLVEAQEAVVCFTVSEDGSVLAPMVVSSTHDALAAPVLAAISGSRFAPARSDGHAVRSTACRTYHFVAR